MTNISEGLFSSRYLLSVKRGDIDREIERCGKNSTEAKVLRASKVAIWFFKFTLISLVIELISTILLFVV